MPVGLNNILPSVMPVRLSSSLNDGCESVLNIKWRLLFGVLMLWFQNTIAPFALFHNTVTVICFDEVEDPYADQTYVSKL